MTKRDNVRRRRRSGRIGLRPNVVQKLKQRKALIFASCILFVFGISFYVLTFTNVNLALAGTSYVWNGSVSSSWDEPLNWTPNGVPDSTDNISFSASSRLLMLNNDKKVGSITCNNTTLIDLRGYTLELYGNLISNSGSSIELHGGALRIDGNVTINGGLISDSDSSGLVMITGSTCSFGNAAGGPTFNASVNINVNNFTTRSATYNRGLVIVKRGPGNDISFGGNTFNGTTEITNSGSGNLLFSNNVHDIFNGVVTFNNTGSSGIYPAFNDVAGTQFNDNIYVNSTGGAGVLFSNGTGTSLLGAGKKINVGINGFIAGTLSLRHFITSNSNDLDLVLPGSGILSLGPGSDFSDEFRAEAGGIVLNGANFKSKVTLIKTGTSNSQGAGGNTFNDSTELINSGSGYFLTGNNLPDLFNGPLSILNSGSSDFYLAHNSAGNQFNSAVKIRNSGSGSTNRVFVCEGNTISSAVFNDTLNLSNSSLATGAMIRFSLRGNCIFRSDILINNTLGTLTNGIYFGASGYTGSSIMDSLHTIKLGNEGFTNGNLSLINFTKLGSDNITLPMIGLSGLTIGPGTSFGGEFESSSSAVSLNGGTFYGNTLIVKTGSSNETGQGKNVFFDSTEISNNGSGNLVMANTFADTFYTDVKFRNSGSGTMQIAQNANGNLFNGKVIFDNIGSGTNNRIFVCEGSASASAIFNDSVFINNLSTATSAYLRFNLRGTTIFNDNLIVNSSGGTGSSNNGLYFGWLGYSGNSSLASGKHIYTGPTGFVKGVLSLIHFSKFGSENDSLIFGNNASLVFGPGLNWNGKLFVSAGGMSLNGGNFSDDISIIKTGATAETGTGGNLFNGLFTLTNHGSGSIIMGNTLPDIFSGESVITNSGTSSIQLANASSGNIFNGNVVFNNSGNGTDNRILIGEGNALATTTFNQDVFVNNTSTATVSMVRFNLRGTTIFNGNLELNNTSGPGSGSCGIYFGLNGYNGSASQVAGKNIRIGNSGFTNGNLYLTRFTQNGTQPDSLLLSTNSVLTLGPFSRLGGNVYSTSGSLYLNGCAFDGTTDVKKTGSTNDNGSGGNSFTGKAIITNAGAGYLLMGNSAGDQFFSDLDVYNTGTSYIYLGHNTSGNQYNGNTNISNNGTGTDTRILIGEGNAAAVNSFNGDVIVNNISNSSDGLVRFNLRGSTIFGGNIILNSTLGTATNNGIAFGWPGYSGNARQANDKTIQIGATGFSKGTLLFQNFTQFSSQSLSLLLSGTGILAFGSNSNFNGNVFITAPDIYLNGTTFNGSVYGEKTGNNTNNNAGNNIFNSNAAFVNSGTGNWIFSNSTKDIYNGDLSLKNNSTGSIYSAYNDASGTEFNGNLYLTNLSTGTIRIGQGTGTSTLAAGKSIAFGSSGFANGSLYLRNFTQSGQSSQSLVVPAGNSILYFQTGTVFNGPLEVSSPQLFLNGSVFNNTCRFTKNGSVNNFCIGGNVFQGPTLIRTSGSGNFYLANSNPDNFNGSVTFNQDSTGILFPAYNGMNNFRGDISTLGSDTLITFAAGSGTVNFAGFNPQAFFGDSIRAPRVRRLSMNNSSTGLTLNVPVNIYGSLSMINGIITTTNSNIIIVENGITTISSVSDLSFVNGPLKKIGNQSFVFPVGKSGRYRPISISAPGLVTDQFTAEYFYENPDARYNTSNKDASLNNVSKCEYWSLVKTGSASNPFVATSWNTNSCGVSSVPDLRVAKWDLLLSKWMDFGNASTSGNSVAGTVLASISSSSYGIFSIGSTSSSNVLPIELTEFKAQMEEAKVIVNWETMSEINNDYFSIERSADGYSFFAIGKVSGGGNTTIKHNYSFIDNEPLLGLSYYRLVQTDYDGSSEIFDPVTIKNKSRKGGLDQIAINPNPFSDHLKINFSTDDIMQLNFELYTMNGSLVSEKKGVFSNGSGEAVLEQLTDLRQGLYILKITSDGQTLFSERVIKN